MTKNKGAPHHILTGRVVAEAGRRPVPDVQIVVFSGPGEEQAESLRLGSTLTCTDGSFTFEYDPVADCGMERPDLRLTVNRPAICGPDSGHEGDTKGVGLLATVGPIKGAGAREAVLIVVPLDDQADELPRTDSGRGDSPEAPEADPHLLRDTRREMGAELASRVKSRARTRTRVREAVQSVLESPGRGAHALYTSPDADPAEVMADVVAADLERLREVQDRAAGKWVAVESLVDVDLADADDRQVVEALPASIVHSESGHSGGPVSLKNTGTEKCRKIAAYRQTIHAIEAGEPEAHEASTLDDADEDLSEDATTDTTAEAAPASDDTETADPIEDRLARLRSRVEGLLLTTDGEETSEGPAGLDQIAASLDQTLNSGPADSTAYYDFHSVRVAFRSTWTRLVDRGLAKELEELYDATVQLEQDFGLREEGDIADITVVDTSETAELNALLRGLEDRVQQIAEVSHMPAYMSSWAVDVSRVWLFLPAELRDYAKTLHWLDTRVRPHHYVQSSERIDTILLDFYDPDSQEMIVRSGSATVPFATPLYAVQFLADIRLGDARDAAWIDGRVRFVAEMGNRARNDAANAAFASAQPSIGRLTALLNSIQRKQEKPHRFDVFTPGSYNFGIVVTYRQAWKPLGYQPGELVSTLPLAPGEVRKYTKTRKVVTKRARKEVEKALSSRRFESRETRRIDAEIVRRAQQSTNFSLSSEGTIDIPMPGGSAGGSFSRAFDANQGEESASTKKRFREAVRSAVSEYKSEHLLEVTTDEETTSEFTESGEIRNPNNEIPVTYLFYELQRRYQIHEELYRVTPVVLVALDMPKPHEIDEAWLLENEWILRRVILDDRMADAFEQLRKVFAGGELAVEVLRRQWETQRKLVEELEQDLGAHVVTRSSARARLARASEASAREESREGMIDSLFESLFGDNASEADAKARSEVADQLLAWAENDLDLAEGKLRDAAAGLQQATKAYVQAVQERLDRRVAIDQLLLHIKQNILYYMQAIWAHEPPDQLFFRLYDLEVRPPRIGEECTVIRESVRTEPDFDPSTGFSSRRYVRVRCPSPDQGSPVELAEIADLSNLLGFKGNYAMFPLRVQNGITEFLMQDYLHSYYGVKDPDPEAERPSLEDLQEVAHCMDAKDIRQPSDGPRIDPAEVRKSLEEFAKTLSSKAEEITVPTGELFIEALPGSHTVLERFKLLHRAEDVRKVGEEVLREQLENYRKGARILQGRLADPDTEKTVVVRGPGGSVNVSVDGDETETDDPGND